MVAGAAGSLTYQWMENGTNALNDGGGISGSGTASLTISNVLGGDAGQYSVIVSNAAGPAASSSALLTVVDPCITNQPASLTQKAGLTAQFSVGVAGTSPVYQWLKNAVPINGASNAGLSLTDISNADAAGYSVVVSNAFGVVTSAVATLTVPNPPLVTTQPLSQTNTAGTTATFTVTATGAAPLSYQWLKNTTTISGATGATLTLSSVSDGNAAAYSVVVSNAAGSVTSSNATLSVLDAPLITSQPLSQTNTAGTTAIFTVSATGAAPLSYQWLKNTMPISGANGATLILVSVAAGDAAGYSVVIINAAGSVTSSSATLTVLGRPLITSQPLSQTNTAGTTATFTVSVTGTAPLSYQWFKNTTPVSGATGATLTLAGVSAGDAAAYSVVIVNAAGSVTSSSATLTVLGPPSITSQPLSQTNAAGTTATFTVSVTGTAQLTYQWFKNTTPISGATGATLILAGVSAGDAAAYSVVIANAAGSVTSSSATLTVLGPPAITSQPLSQTNTAGTTATFTVSATGTAPLTYQWFKNTTPIGGATGATLTLAGVSAGDAAAYSVIIANAAGGVTSSSATLTVLGPPAITSQPLSQTNAAGTTATFTVSVTGTAQLTYQWFKNTTPIWRSLPAGLCNSALMAGTSPVYQWLKNALPIPGATSATLNLAGVSDADAADYSVVVSNAFGVLTSIIATLQVADALDHF